MGPEGVDVSTDQPGTDGGLEGSLVRTRHEERIAPGQTREDDVGTLADRNAAVLEDQHDRNHGPGLDDPGVARSEGLPLQEGAIRPGTRLDRLQVLVEVA
jgi:hypothetical protein